MTNIWGYKKKIREAKNKLKKGEREIGYRKYKHLEKQITCWKHCLEKQRKNKI